MSITPKGSQIVINSLHYKIGVLSKPFYFNDEEWWIGIFFTNSGNSIGCMHT